MTKAEVAALGELAGRATPGPLRLEPEHTDQEGNFIEATIWYDLRKSEVNAQFFAASRTAVPELIQQLNKAMELLNRIHVRCPTCGISSSREPLSCDVAEAIRKWEGDTK